MPTLAPTATVEPQARPAAVDAPPRQRLVILGAGVAGLALALRLGEGGRWHPLLLEREERAGGLARCLHFKGISTDMGPHRIHTEIPEVDRLIEEIAAPSLFRVRRTSHIYLRGHFLKYPPAPFEMARRLGPLAMARFGASFARERLRPAPRPETYESLMRRAFGPALYEFLIKPYSAKTWKIDPAELHADTARVRVSAGSLAKMVGGLFGGGQRKGGETALKEFRYVRGGAETLVRHLWEHAQELGAELRTGCPAEALELDEQLRVVAARLQMAGTIKAGNGHGNGNGNGNGNGHALPHGLTAGAALAQTAAASSPLHGPLIEGDFFCSTVPLPLLLGKLLPPRPELAAARQAAAGLEYIDMRFVVLVVRRKLISGDNWLYFPEPHLIFNRAYEAKNFDPTMAPAEKSVLCVEITLRKGDPIEATSDADLVRMVTRQMASTGLLREDEVEEGVVYPLRWAYPLYTLDYDTRLDQALAGMARIPNLLTLGRQGLFNHNNMDHSIWMGLRAAEELNRGGLDDVSRRWHQGAGEFKRMRIVD